MEEAEISMGHYQLRPFTSYQFSWPSEYFKGDKKGFKLQKMPFLTTYFNLEKMPFGNCSGARKKVRIEKKLAYF